MGNKSAGILNCLFYTTDAAGEKRGGDLRGRPVTLKKKKKTKRTR